MWTTQQIQRAGPTGYASVTYGVQLYFDESSLYSPCDLKLPLHPGMLPVLATDLQLLQPVILF